MHVPVWLLSLLIVVAVCGTTIFVVPQLITLGKVMGMLVVVCAIFVVLWCYLTSPRHRI